MQSKFDSAVRAYAENLLRYRWAVLGGTVLLAVFAAVGATKLKFDTSYRIWHAEDSPQLKTFDERVAKFGGDDSIMLVFQDTRGIITNEVLTIVQRITDKVWRIPGVKRTDSVSNFSIIRGSRPEHESPALAVAGGKLISAGDRNDLLVWDLNGFAQRQLLGHEGLIEHVVASPDGAKVYSASLDRTVRAWDLASGANTHTFRGLPEAVSALALTPDGARLVAGSYKTTAIFDTASGKLVRRLDGHEDFVTRIVLSPDGRTAWIASKQVHRWDLESGEKKGVLEGHSGFVTGMVLSADGKRLYTSGDDGRVLSFDTESGAKTELLAPKAMALSLALAPDGKVVAGFSDGTVRAVAPEGGSPIVARVHDGWVMDLAVAKDGRVFSGSRDRDTAVHIPGQGPKAVTLQAHRASVRRVLTDGTRLYTSGDDGDIYVWKQDTLEMEARLTRMPVEQKIAAAKFDGPPTGRISVVNGFRYPVEIKLAGEAKGVVTGHAALAIDNIAIPQPKPCQDDTACGSGQYCDLEADTPVCTGRMLIEAFIPGTTSRIWSSETFLQGGQVITVRAPTDEPFSVSAVAEGPFPQETRAKIFLDSLPAGEVRTAAEKALLKVTRSDAVEPETFLSPQVAEGLAAELRGVAGMPEEKLQFLTTQAQAKVQVNRLPVEPFRLREVDYYLMRGPRPAARGSALNDARDTTIIFANVHTDETISPLEQGMKVRRSLEKVVAEEQAATGIKFQLAGDCIQDTTFAEYAERDAKVLLPAFVLAVILVLAYWYRRPAGVFLPISLVMLAVMNTMGIGGWFGAELNNMTIGVPQIVLACCIGDLNHVFNGFNDHLRHGEDRRTAVINTIVHEFVPCFWTASTTAIGFFSMMLTTEVVPIRTFGWMGGIAAMAAWFGTFTVMPCILSFLPVPKNLGKEEIEHKHAEGKTTFLDKIDNGMVSLSGYVNRTSGAMIFMLLVLTGVAAYGFTKVKFDSKSVELFSLEAPFRKAYNFVGEHITGPIGLTVIVDTNEAGGIRKVKHLQELARLHDHLEADPEVTGTVGINDILKGMNRVMNGDLDENYRVPETDAKASSYYNAYTFSLSAGLELTNRVSADESSTLVDVRVKDHSAKWIVAWGEGLQEWAKTNTPGLDVQVTSKLWLYSHMLTALAANFFQDIGQAVFMISLTLFFLARNFRLGWISMLVNLMPLFVTVGFMSLFGFNMDVAVLVSCSVAMGIVVDDTIHYIAKYKIAREEHGMTHAEATEELAKEHSKASVATFLVLVGGFLMFTFTDYQINRNLGITVGVMLAIGAAFDLFGLPAMLAVWGPKEMKKPGAHPPPSHGGAPVEERKKDVEVVP